MYRSATYRRVIFDTACTTFVKEVFKYSNQLSSYIPKPCAINDVDTLVYDYLDTAITTGSINTELEDKTLDYLLVK
jgi:hypothetical protein